MGSRFGSSELFLRREDGIGIDDTPDGGDHGLLHHQQLHLNSEWCVLRSLMHPKSIVLVRFTKIHFFCTSMMQITGSVMKQIKDICSPQEVYDENLEMSFESMHPRSGGSSMSTYQANRRVVHVCVIYYEKLLIYDRFVSSCGARVSTFPFRRTTYLLGI